MPDTRFDWVLMGLAAAFVVVLAVVVGPTFFGDGLNVFTAFEKSFVNPYAAAVSVDALFTYALLAAWVIYESQHREVRHGWLALVLGLIGITVGLAFYLLVRHREIGPQARR